MWDLEGAAIAAGLLVPVLIIVAWCLRLARRPVRPRKPRAAPADRTPRLVSIGPLPRPPLPTRERNDGPVWPPVPQSVHVLRQEPPAPMGFTGPDPGILQQVVDGLRPEYDPDWGHLQLRRPS